MSNVHISVVRATGITSQGTAMLVESAVSYGATAAETIASSGTSQTATIVPASQQTGDQVSFYAWRVANMGTDHVYVAFNTAATSAGKGVPAGTVAFFACGAFGDTIAVKNV